MRAQREGKRGGGLNSGNGRKGFIYDDFKSMQDTVRV